MTTSLLDAEGAQTVLAWLAESRAFDLRDFALHAAHRGIEARMRELGCAHVDEYLSHLARDTSEAAALVAAVAVPLSTFFRDGPVFHAIDAKVLPELLMRLSIGGTLRAWSAGTATGEEAWSIAMQMAEQCGSFAEYEVMATDRDEPSLAVAARGMYPGRQLEAVSSARRARWLRDEGDHACIVDELRARVSFERHDLIGATLAPPSAIIASYHLILCRNVLIYFDRRMQRKVLERLAASLEPRGALILGPSEWVSPADCPALEPFPGLDPSLRVFRRR